MATGRAGGNRAPKLFHNFAKVVLDMIITKMHPGPNLLIGGDVSRDDPEAKQGAVPAGPVSSPVTREPREISRQALRPVRGVELIGSHVQSRGDPVQSFESSPGLAKHSSERFTKAAAGAPKGAIKPLGALRRSAFPFGETEEETEGWPGTQFHRVAEHCSRGLFDN